MARFYYLRHGETDWNIIRRRQGQTDIALNDRGRAQAQASVFLLHELGIQTIVASSLSRARETADIINHELGVDLMIDERLQEICFGSGEGKTLDVIKSEAETAPENYIFGTIFPFPLARDAEDIGLFHDRVKKAVLEHLGSRQGPVLFVSHGGVFLSLQNSFLGKAAIVSGNAVPYVFSSHHDTWSMHEIRKEDA